MYLLLQRRKLNPHRNQNQVQEGQMEAEKDGNLPKVTFYIHFDFYQTYIDSYFAISIQKRKALRNNRGLEK